MRKPGTTIFFDGIKAVPVSDDVPGFDWAWKQLGGEKETDALTGKRAYSIVSAIRRAVNIRAQALADAPRHVYRKDGTEVAEADVPALAGLRGLLWRLNASLDVAGAAYALKVRRDALKWFVSSTVTVKADETTGALTFTRQVGDKRVEYKQEQMVYLFAPTPFVEVGPGPSLIEAALNAAGVLVSLQTFNAAFFARGAIAPQLLSMPDGEGITPGESERLKTWFNQAVNGIKNAFGTEIVRKKVETVKLGVDDLRMLEHGAITEDQQKQIAIAFEIPYTMLYSGAANYATAKEDVMTFWDAAMRPRASLVEEALNAQYLAPLGYSIEFALDELSAFQEDEVRRAGSLTSLVGAMVPQDMALEQLGYSLTGEQRARVRMRALMREGMNYDDARKVFEASDPELAGDEIVRLTLDALKPAAKPEPMQQPGAENVDAQGDMVQTQNPDQQPKLPTYSSVSAKSADLDKWERKALKALRAGKPASVPFESEHIDDALAGAIAGGLEAATTATAIRSVFAGVTTTPASIYDMQLDHPTHGRKDDEMNVHIHLPPNIAVEMKATQPAIIVNVPEQAAPVVNVAVPEQAAPVVNVTTPPQVAPVVNVTTPQAVREVQIVTRNSEGLMTGSETVIEYKE